MANDVKTVVKFKNLNHDDIQFILQLIATPVKDEYFGETYIMDFNKIVPEPETEDECPERYKRTDKDPFEKLADKPWFNWYQWRIDNWDTKWNTYDGYTIIEDSFIMFVFNTAWNFAYPVIEKLQILNYDIEVMYADEDLGSNCGALTFSNEQGRLESLHL